MTKYGLHNKLDAKNGKAEELAKLLLEASKVVSKAKGCCMYMVSREEKTLDSIWVTEVWDTKEDHDDSLKIPEVREVISKAMPILAGMPEGGQQLVILGDYVLNFN